MWPLFARDRGGQGRRRAVPRGIAHDSAVRALREIEFDRATGKLADADYESLKASYTARALTELRSADAAAAAITEAGATPSNDVVEALIARARSSAVTCAVCESLCPEPDAVYCSTCGHYLPGRCNKCGVTIAESGARYCSACGWTLAA